MVRRETQNSNYGNPLMVRLYNVHASIKRTLKNLAKYGTSNEDIPKKIRGEKKVHANLAGCMNRDCWVKKVNGKFRRTVEKKATD